MLTNDTRAGKIITVIACIAITVIGLMMCEPARAQIRLSAGAGVISTPSLVGQLNVSYEKNFFVSADMVRQVVKSGTWFSLKGGYVLNVDDQTKLRIYSGIGYKPGREHSYDRYIKDGVVQYLSTGLPTREVVVPVGMQIVNGPLFIDAGAMAG